MLKRSYLPTRKRFHLPSLEELYIENVKFSSPLRFQNFIEMKSVFIADMDPIYRRQVEDVFNQITPIETSITVEEFKYLDSQKTDTQNESRVDFE